MIYVKEMQGFVFKLLVQAPPPCRKSDSCGHFPIFDAVNCTAQGQCCLQLQVDVHSILREKDTARSISSYLVHLVLNATFSFSFCGGATDINTPVIRNESYAFIHGGSSLVTTI